MANGRGTIPSAETIKNAKSRRVTPIHAEVYVFSETGGKGYFSQDGKPSSNDSKLAASNHTYDDYIMNNPQGVSMFKKFTGLINSLKLDNVDETVTYDDLDLDISPCDDIPDARYGMLFGDFVRPDESIINVPIGAKNQDVTIRESMKVFDVRGNEIRHKGFVIPGGTQASVKSLLENKPDAKDGIAYMARVTSKKLSIISIHERRKDNGN
jgi:hypothetical protein